MEAIEFKAKAEAGIIKIPDKFKEIIKDEVRVIILIDKNITRIHPNATKFLSVKIRTSDFKFSRDEANAR